MIVESSFRARKELVSLLASSGLVRSIDEAPSVTDGIQRLGSGRIELCVVGRQLSLERACWFLKNAKQLTATKSCAFLAFTPEEANADELGIAGADAVSWLPLEQKTFTALVEEAISSSKTRHRRKSPTKEELSFIDERLVRPPSYESAPLADVLFNLAERFELLSREIDRGRFKTSPTGLPTLAVEDSLRLVIENAFPRSSEAWRIGSPEHAFVSAIVEWFLDRIHMDPPHANDALRKKLLGR